MTTQLIRSSMKLMADAGVDIVDMKWFDMTGAVGDSITIESRRANLPNSLISCLLIEKLKLQF